MALPLGVVAVVLGIMGRHRVKHGDATNKGMATVGVALGGLALVLAGAVVAMGAAFLSSDSGRDYNNCLEKATGQAQRDQCAKQFERDITR
ncbi:DUF4190 domain-containing protein [Actinomadura sp. HBU206391]|nr:DUF4190 domain-containing protein [Actinomadura sp. HBU206391]